MTKFAKDVVVILGGTGFIGRNVARRLIKDNYEVYSISRDPIVDGKRITGLHYFFLNEMTLYQISKCLNSKKIKFIINCSGEVSHSCFTDNGYRTIESHLTFPLKIISYFDLSELQKFLQVGTGDEYVYSSALISETNKTTFSTPYTFAKFGISTILDFLHSSEGFPFVGVKIFLAYGEDQDNNRLIPQVIESCLADAPFDCSDGSQMRDFCHIDDIVEGMSLILDKDGILGETFNLASGRPVSVKEVIKEIVEVSGGGRPQWGRYKETRPEDDFKVADISKAKSLLAWEPKVNLGEGLKRCIVSRQSHNG